MSGSKNVSRRRRGLLKVLVPLGCIVVGMVVMAIVMGLSTVVEVLTTAAFTAVVMLGLAIAIGLPPYLILIRQGRRPNDSRTFRVVQFFVDNVLCLLLGGGLAYGTYWLIGVWSAALPVIRPGSAGRPLGVYSLTAGLVVFGVYTGYFFCLRRLERRRYGKKRTLAEPPLVARRPEPRPAPLTPSPEGVLNRRVVAPPPDPPQRVSAQGDMGPTHRPSGRTTGVGNETPLSEDAKTTERLEPHPPPAKPPTPANVGSQVGPGGVTREELAAFLLDPDITPVRTKPLVGEGVGTTTV